MKPNNPTTVTWIRRHCCITLPRVGSRPISPYPYQFALWEDRSRQRIVLKSRQMGVSRALACEAVYLAINQPGSTILFVSRSLYAARNLLRYASQSISESSRTGLLPAPSSKNTTTMEWADRESRIVSLAASIDAARSYSATAVYLDEAAYLPWAEEIYQALAPTVANRGRMTVVSTPHGRGNLFHRLWEEALLNQNRAWSTHRIHWSRHPEYTSEWAERERQRHTARSWAEEYELSFEDSGSSVFAEAHIQALLRPTAQTTQPPCCAGLDLARSSDYTALLILDSAGQIVELQRFNGLSWTLQVERVARVLARYPGCTIHCDATGVGDPVVELLRSQLVSQHGSARIRLEPFVYTSDSRTLLLQDLILAIETGEIWVASPEAGAEPQVSLPHSQALLSELRSFQWETTAGGKAIARHPPGGHDDCLQALALAWKGMLQARRRPRQLVNPLVAVGTTPLLRFSRSCAPVDDDDWDLPHRLIPRSLSTW